MFKTQKQFFRKYVCLKVAWKNEFCRIFSFNWPIAFLQSMKHFGVNSWSYVHIIQLFQFAVFAALVFSKLDKLCDDKF